MSDFYRRGGGGVEGAGSGKSAMVGTVHATNAKGGGGTAATHTFGMPMAGTPEMTTAATGWEVGRASA